MQQAVFWVRDTTFDLWQILHSKNGNRLARDVLRWKPPEIDWMKCNVDGAYYPVDGSGEIGLVLRDHRGAFAGGRVNTLGSTLCTDRARFLSLFYDSEYKRS